MSWEDSSRKEQVFRKTKQTKEVILKTVESEDGKIKLIFALKNNESITELSLSVAEWKSILAFLNITSAKIHQEIDEKQVKPTARPVAEPIIEVEAEPVPEEDFEKLATEMQKVANIHIPAVTVVPSEEVITEIPKRTAKEEEPTLEQSILQSSAEVIDETAVTEEPIIDSEGEDSEIPQPFEIDLETLLSPPKIPKISQPSKDDLESLLTPILKPKISSMDVVEPEVIINEASSTPPESPQEKTDVTTSSDSSQISASELLNDSIQKETTPEPTDIPVMLSKEDEALSTDEKEAKILAAMEEVAALMPPGPAKKFVEEMMLKRTDEATSNHPRIPQKISSDSESPNN